MRGKTYYAFGRAMPKINTIQLVSNGERMNIWSKFATLPDYVKRKSLKHKGKKRQRWLKNGELKGIRSVDSRFVKK
jgi:hypothetical protein